MALERAARRSRRGVPEPDRLVARPRPRRDQLAVRRECDRVDVTRMALERAARRSRRGVPEPNYLVARTIRRPYCCPYRRPYRRPYCLGSP